MNLSFRPVVFVARRACSTNASEPVTFNLDLHQHPSTCWIGNSSLLRASVIVVQLAGERGARSARTEVARTSAQPSIIQASSCPSTPSRGISGTPATVHPLARHLRAIALGLRRLRKIERYALAPVPEQYTGFLQLEQSNQMTTAEAGEGVHRRARRHLPQRGRKLHPDNPDGG